MKELSAFFLLLSGGLMSIATAQTTPNILIILADDAGYADFGFMGSKEIQTPQIDKLAAMGTVFTDAHVAATVSSPSRAMMMTGRYGQRFGYECNTTNIGGLPESEETIAELLKKYDYRTACIGKWHLGTLDSQHPNQKGFDNFYGMIGGSRNYFYNANKDDREGRQTQYQHNGKGIPFDGYFTDELTRRGKEFIAAGTTPFLLDLSYTAPHSPNQATDEDMKRFEGNPRQKLAAMMWALDRGVGEIVEQLKKTNQFDNTIIFFLSDNGGSTMNNSSNLPLKGFKGNKFEGGQRVPFFVVWGDKFKSQENFTGLSSALDIFATVVDAVNIPKKKLNKKLDGVSLLPYLYGKKKGNPHKTLYWRKMDTRAIRDKDYKLILTRNVDTVLYNIAEQIDEHDNLLFSEPKKAKQLIKKLAKWEKNECIEPIWIENGWGPTTNGYHQKLMNNEIKTADDLRKKKKK